MEARSVFEKKNTQKKTFSRTFAPSSKAEADRLQSKLTTTILPEPRRLDRTDSSLDELLFDSALATLPLERTLFGLRHITLPVRDENRRTAYLVHLTITDPATSSSSLLKKTVGNRDAASYAAATTAASAAISSSSAAVAAASAAAAAPSAKPASSVHHHRLEESSTRNEELLHFRDVLQHIYGKLYKRTNYENLKDEPGRRIDPRKLANLSVVETSVELKRKREKAAHAVSGVLTTESGFFFFYIVVVGVVVVVVFCCCCWCRCCCCCCAVM